MSHFPQTLSSGTQREMPLAEDPEWTSVEWLTAAWEEAENSNTSNDQATLAATSAVHPTPCDFVGMTVIQQPGRAKQCRYKNDGSSKEAPTMEQPPVIRIQWNPALHPDSIASTHTFLMARLQHADKERDGVKADKLLEGQRVGAIHWLTDLDGMTGYFGVFPSLSVKIPGRYKLEFLLYAEFPNPVTAQFVFVTVARVMSSPFEVISRHLYDGRGLSSQLTRDIAAQGVKVRLMTSKRKPKCKRREARLKGGEQPARTSRL
ncbi:velum formation- protein [Ophidiomyces ophidiicola]|nr:velum formation- protein [Ophidiomyces ophidiicola]KAI2003126.1 velum formation- protein [Ophidiomyces ophidiicola]